MLIIHTKNLSMGYYLCGNFCYENVIKLLHILLFHNNFLKIYKILQKNPLYILNYFILLLYMI